MSSFDASRRAIVVPLHPSRLTYRRLRHPTPVPVLASDRGWGRYFGRLARLFG